MCALDSVVFELLLLLCVILGVICLNYVGAMLGISALSVGFTGQTGFTFKLVHGEKMSETIGHIELNRYVVQVFILTVVIYISLNTSKTIQTAFYWLMLRAFASLYLDSRSN